MYVTENQWSNQQLNNTETQATLTTRNYYTKTGMTAGTRER